MYHRNILIRHYFCSNFTYHCYNFFIDGTSEIHRKKFRCGRGGEFPRGNFPGGNPQGKNSPRGEFYKGDFS